MMLSGNELQRVRNKCSYDDELNEWSIPSFFLKGKEVQLPKLGGGREAAVIEAEKENRDLMFGDDDDEEDKDYDQIGMSRGAERAM